MSLFGAFQLKLRRGESPFYRFLRGILKWALHFNVPLPAILKPALRLLYGLHYAVIVVFRRMLIVFYREPLFRSRCASVGRNLNLYFEMPYVQGHAEIVIGDDITIAGDLAIISGRFLDRPKLRIENRTVIGGGTVISVNREVTIEEDVMISTNCRVADNDGHPRDAQLRAAYAPLEERDMRPVRICRYAWIGNGTQIMKGVTIGEGAIIGANSVVISSIPPYCIAMGNPAEILVRNVGRKRNGQASAAGAQAR